MSDEVDRRISTERWVRTESFDMSLKHYLDDNRVRTHHSEEIPTERVNQLKNATLPTAIPRKRRRATSNKKTVSFRDTVEYRVFRKGSGPVISEEDEGHWLDCCNIHLPTGMNSERAFNEGIDLKRLEDEKSATVYWAEVGMFFQDHVDLWSRRMGVRYLGHKGMNKHLGPILYTVNEIGREFNEKAVIENVKKNLNDALAEEKIREAEDKAQLECLKNYFSSSSSRRQLFKDEMYKKWFGVYINVTLRLKALQKMPYLKNLRCHHIPSVRFRSQTVSEMLEDLNAWFSIIHLSCQEMAGFEDEALIDLLSSFSADELRMTETLVEVEELITTEIDRSWTHWKRAISFLKDPFDAWSKIKTEISTIYVSVLNSLSITALINDDDKIKQLLKTIEVPAVVSEGSQDAAMDVDLKSDRSRITLGVLPAVKKFDEVKKTYQKCPGVNYLSIMLKDSVRADLDYSNKSGHTHDPSCKGHMCFLLLTLLRMGKIHALQDLISNDLSCSFLARKKLCVGSVKKMQWIRNLDIRKYKKRDYADSFNDERSIFLRFQYEQLPFAVCVAEFIADNASAKQFEKFSEETMLQAEKLFFDLMDSGVKLKHKIPALWRFIPILDKVREKVEDLKMNRSKRSSEDEMRRTNTSATASRLLKFKELSRKTLRTLKEPLGRKDHSFKLENMLEPDFEHDFSTTLALQVFQSLSKSVTNDLIKEHGTNKLKISFMFSGIILQGAALAGKWDLVEVLLPPKVSRRSRVLKSAAICLISEIDSNNILKRRSALHALSKLDLQYGVLKMMGDESLLTLSKAVRHQLSNGVLIPQDDMEILEKFMSFDRMKQVTISMPNEDKVPMKKLCHAIIFHGLWNLFDEFVPHYFTVLQTLADSPKKNMEEAAIYFLDTGLHHLVEERHEAENMFKFLKFMESYLSADKIASILRNMVDEVLSDSELDIAVDYAPIAIKLFNAYLFYVEKSKDVDVNLKLGLHRGIMIVLLCLSQNIKDALRFVDGRPFRFYEKREVIEVGRRLVLPTSMIQLFDSLSEYILMTYNSDDLHILAVELKTHEEKDLWVGGILKLCNRIKDKSHSKQKEKKAKIRRRQRGRAPKMFVLKHRDAMFLKGVMHKLEKLADFQIDSEPEEGTVKLSKLEPASSTLKSLYEEELVAEAEVHRVFGTEALADSKFDGCSEML